MKTTRSFVCFLLVFLASISITFDWKDYSIGITSKSQTSKILEVYDEICTPKRSLITHFKNLVIISKESKSIFTSLFIDIKTFRCNDFVSSIEYVCKIKSYLHLLQLF